MQMNALNSELQQTVQHNCDISDARFARDYSLCVYLLRMQEHYRWRNSLSLTGPIDGEVLGNWVRETEDYWDTIEETEFKPLTINKTTYHPFDNEAINRALEDSPLVYTAGYGRLGQPHFVLAECVRRSNAPYPQLELGHEIARDSITLPAMSRDGTIIIRHDAINRMLWQMTAEWRLREAPGPMARLLAHYHIDANHPHEDRITAAATDLSPVFIHHEQGEIVANKHLGGDYVDMLVSLQGKPGEGYIRAVGDLLADALGTWPYLVEHQASTHLDFWLAGLQGIRESILQPVGLQQRLLDSGNAIKELSVHSDKEQQRWEFVAKQLMTEFNRQGTGFDYKTTIEQAVQKKP